MFYVYIMRGQKRNVKIGVSKDPYKRLKALQTGHSAKLRILEMFAFESRLQAYDIEKRFHHTYRRHRISGEWFRFSMYQEFKAKRNKNFGNSLDFRCVEPDREEKGLGMSEFKAVAC